MIENDKKRPHWPLFSSMEAVSAVIVVYREVPCMNKSSPVSSAQKILLIDDHALARCAVTALLKPYPQFSVIAEAANGADALRLARLHLPDIILLDIELPDLSGVEVAKRLLQIHPCRIIVLTSHSDRFYIGPLLKLGIHGYLSKNCQPTELLEALLTTHNHLPFIDQQMTEHLTQQLFGESLPPVPFETLSQRELEIVFLLCRGEKMASIARKLFLSPKTISMHRQTLFKKLHVANATELAKLAFQHKLIDPN